MSRWWKVEGRLWMAGGRTARYSKTVYAPTPEHAISRARDFTFSPRTATPLKEPPDDAA